MAVKISSITMSPNEVKVGQSFTVTIAAVDVTWEILKNEFENWNKIKTERSNWRDVLNYH